MLRTGRGRLLLGAAVVVLVGAGFGVWWFFIRDDAPPEASVEAASEGQAQDDSSGSGDGGSISPDDVEGNWVVEQTPDAEDGSGTFAGYRIQEELATIGGQTAVGRTRDVTGAATIEGGQLTDAQFEVDMTTLQSDENLRDDRLRTQGLQTDQYPTATFTLTETLDLPDEAAAGEEVPLQAVGDLTLHGVTRSITVDLNASFNDETIAVAGSASVVLADYEIEKPTGLSVLSIEDQGTFELQLLLAQE